MEKRKMPQVNGVNKLEEGLKQCVSRLIRKCRNLFGGYVEKQLKSLYFSIK